ncbi:hypothetical protein [Caudoviricetes sp.]|nr:hypothetical protein [Caudoviricetes sp.]
MVRQTYVSLNRKPLTVRKGFGKKNSMRTATGPRLLHSETKVTSYSNFTLIIGPG